MKEKELYFDKKQQVARKAKLEQVSMNFGSSFSFKKFDYQNPNNVLNWHYHPEVEILFIERGSGVRYVGSHISKFEDGDLVLLGSNLPHYGFDETQQAGNFQYVLQFDPSILRSDMTLKPEFREIGQLLIKASGGISFYGNTKRVVGEMLNKMWIINPFDRYLIFLSLLQILAQSQETNYLQGEGMTVVIEQQESDRMKVIQAFIEKEFMNEITLTEVSQLVNLTVPSFCRYFKSSTKKTFIQYLNEYRIQKATQLMDNHQYNLTQISIECGFNQFAHFAKVFKKITGQSPGAYRKSLSEIVQ